MSGATAGARLLTAMTALLLASACGGGPDAVTQAEPENPEVVATTTENANAEADSPEPVEPEPQAEQGDTAETEPPEQHTPSATAQPAVGHVTVEQDGMYTSVQEIAIADRELAPGATLSMVTLSEARGPFYIYRTDAAGNVVSFEQVCSDPQIEPEVHAAGPTTVYLLPVEETQDPAQIFGQIEHLPAIRLQGTQEMVSFTSTYVPECEVLAAREVRYDVPIPETTPPGEYFVTPDNYLFWSWRFESLDGDVTWRFIDAEYPTVVIQP